jgi:hypothetical protein
MSYDSPALPGSAGLMERLLWARLKNDAEIQFES